MADRSAIEWTDSTFNPWTGCTKVSPGCDHCYAESWSVRAGAKVGKWGPGAPRVRTTPANWRLPVKWNAEPFIECASCNWRGEKRAFFQTGPRGGRWTMCPNCASPDWIPARRRVFCASLADVFDNEVPGAWRADLFALIAATPNLDWLLLTKRIGNADRMMRDATPLPPVPANWPWPASPWKPPANVWLGATIVDQAEADRDIPKLLATPAAVRFLSMEPLLGFVDLTRIQMKASDAPERGKPPVTMDALRGWYGGDGDPARLHWVIVGGESGHGARAMSPDWARSLRDQCVTAGVPFLFKQWGEWLPMLGQAEGVPVTKKTTTLDGWVIGWAGKKAAGRMLDSRTHDGFPAGVKGTDSSVPPSEPT